MKKKKSNLLQKKKSYYNKNNKENRNFKISNANKNKGVRYIENKMNESKDVKVVEITPRLSSIDINNQDLDFDSKVEALAEELKTRILQLHQEGNSVRFIADKVHMSRESVRKVIKGESSLKILAMERVRAQEIEQMKF